MFRDKAEDAGICAYFKDDNAAKRKISSYAAHCTLIVLSKQYNQSKTSAYSSEHTSTRPLRTPKSSRPLFAALNI